MRTKILSALFLSSAAGVVGTPAAAQNFYGSAPQNNANSAPWSVSEPKLSDQTLSILNGIDQGGNIVHPNTVSVEWGKALTSRTCLSIQSPFMYEDNKTQRGFEIGGTTRLQFKTLLGENANDDGTRMSCQKNGAHYDLFNDPTIDLGKLDKFKIFEAEQARKHPWGGPDLRQ